VDLQTAKTEDRIRYDLRFGSYGAKKSTCCFLFFFGNFACNIGRRRPPAKRSEADGERDIPLILTTKYEPDIVKTDRDIEV